jgi:hypothetical protein
MAAALRAVLDLCDQWDDDRPPVELIRTAIADAIGVDRG